MPRNRRLWVPLGAVFVLIVSFSSSAGAADRRPADDIGGYALFATDGDILWYGATAMPAGGQVGANGGAVRFLDSTEASAEAFLAAAAVVEVQGASHVTAVATDNLLLGEQAVVDSVTALDGRRLVADATLPAIDEIECGGESITVTSGNSPLLLAPGRYDTITVTMNQRIELVEGGHYELCRLHLNRGSSVLVHGDNRIYLRDFLSTEARVRMEGAGACGARWVATGVIDSGTPNSAAFDFGDGNGSSNRALIAGQFLTPGRIAMEQHNDYVGRFWAGDILAGPESDISRTLSDCTAAYCGDGNLDPGEDCDDGNNREGDCCSADCRIATEGAACDDGSFCTAVDTCDAEGRCRGTGDPCAGPDGDGNCSETCNPATGACDGPDPFGSVCDDGLFCNGADRCEAGVCTGVGPAPCGGADGDGDCRESCDEAARSCTAPDPLGSACNDGAFCTTADRCREGGVCAGDNAPPCPGPDGDGNCRESCNEDADDCTAPDPAGTSCSDGLFCTTTDTCDAGGQCLGSGDPCAVADGDANCREACDEATRTCAGLDPDGTPCEDGVACTTGDTCSLGTCLSGAESSCDDANPCTDDYCDLAGGCTHAFNNAPCDDGDACTLVDRCEQGVCRGGEPVNCEDGDLCSVDSCDPRDGTCSSALIPDLSCNEEGDARTRFSMPFTPASPTSTAALTAMWRGVRDGRPTGRAELADPTSGGSWALCVFDTDAGRNDLRYRIELDAAGLDKRAWKRRETQSKLVYKLRAPHGTAGGASKAKMIVDRHDRAILKLAAGANVGCKADCRAKFAPPAPISDERLFAMEPETLVQWKSSAGGCWSARYVEARENTPLGFAAAMRSKSRE